MAVIHKTNAVPQPDGLGVPQSKHPSLARGRRSELRVIHVEYTALDAQGLRSRLLRVCELLQLEREIVPDTCHRARKK